MSALTYVARLQLESAVFRILCSQSYGVEIVVGETARAKAPAFALIELNLVAANETTEPTRIFALLGDDRLARSPEFTSLVAEHETMLARYRQRA